MHLAGLLQRVSLFGQVAGIPQEVGHVLGQHLDRPGPGSGHSACELLLPPGQAHGLIVQAFPGVGEPVGAPSFRHGVEGDLQGLVVQDHARQVEPARAEGALHRGLAAPSSGPPNQC